MNNPAVIIIGIAVVLAAVIFILFRNKKDEWVDTDAFLRAREKVRPRCSEKEFQEFMEFLNSYKGGFVRRKNGTIVEQGYSGTEKGILKGIFYNIAVPNPNLSISTKEQFRKKLVSIGVNDVNERPSYETRDSRLKNRELSIDGYQRKDVGNKGERAVRDVLNGLDMKEYSVVNGPALKHNDVVHEFDHIVVGKTGLFVLETKAFGMSDGKPCKAALFVDPGDKWIIRKNGKNRDLESPTNQLTEEKKLLESIIECPVEVHSVLVLSNKDIFVKKNIRLPYDVVKVDELKAFIENYHDVLSENDKLQILQKMNQGRIN